LSRPWVAAAVGLVAISALPVPSGPLVHVLVRRLGYALETQIPRVDLGTIGIDGIIVLGGSPTPQRPGDAGVHMSGQRATVAYRRRSSQSVEISDELRGHVEPLAETHDCLSNGACGGLGTGNRRRGQRHAVIEPTKLDAGKMVDTSNVEMLIFSVLACPTLSGDCQWFNHLSISRRMQHPKSEFDAIVRLSGGFGNQLFQYAFGTQLEAVHGRRVGYDLEFYKRPNDVAHNRLRLIEYGFDVPEIEVLPNGCKGARRFKWLPPSVQQVLFGLSYVKCPATRHVPVRPISGLTYFAGLWKSPKYFDAIEDKVRSEFRSRLLIAGGMDSTIIKGTIGFHVRRGDYLTHEQSYNLDYQSYISAALAKLIEVTDKSNWTVAVYTDDPVWCRANLKVPGLVVNTGNGMLDDFLGLMQCEHKIISNSTFAWWAAFLGETPDSGMVFAPSRWHAIADNEAARILRDGWVVVEV
jgi:Glycosyl transferase family 11